MWLEVYMTRDGESSGIFQYRQKMCHQDIKNIFGGPVFVLSSAGVHFHMKTLILFLH